jgi:hypothetical protein
MQELAKAITEVVDGAGLDFYTPLEEAAKKWACYVLDHNTDKALELGLKISQSIVDYTNELKP